MSGSRVDIPDAELAQEWPFLTRQQLEEYKDAFKIFDRQGVGSFTAEDIGWVMRSLGQNPTQQQIDAIIRDMDLDNDGVIDLAEFMIRMMALTTQTAAEEDLKHVFDVLDKSGEGMINADSLRTAIKNIAEWEMTDDDIEVAIKLADKSGDGRIDYDEFIAFVFGDNEPVQRLQQPGTNTLVPEADTAQLPAAPSQAAAPPAATGLSDSLHTQQAAADMVQQSAEEVMLSHGSWPGREAQPSAQEAPVVQPFFSASDQMQAVTLSARQQSLTDAWVAAQAADVASAAAQPAEPTFQACQVYDNELYQEGENAPRAPQARAARHVPLWELEDQPASSSLPEQLGDDVRLDVQPDDLAPDHMDHTAGTVPHHLWFDQARSQATSYPEYDSSIEGQAAATSSTQWVQLRQETGLSAPTTIPPDVQQPTASSAHASSSQQVELSTAPETVAPQADKTKLWKGKPPPSKAPRKLPALSSAQLSKGVNRSQVKQSSHTGKS